MSSQTVVLITGANRGIGKAFLETYLSRPRHTVIAAVRDTTHSTSQALQSLPTASSSKLITIKLDATEEKDAQIAAQLLQRDYQVHRVDILIANAGISQSWPKVSEVTIAELQKHMVPNVHGVIWLYQAFLPLLNAAPAPKWVSIGSSAATLTRMEALPIPNAAYGPSKVVLNWLTAKMHFEEPGLTAIVMDPGWVQTDLGNNGAAALGYGKAEILVEDSVGGMMKVIDAATKEKHSGKFWSWSGNQLTW